MREELMHSACGRRTRSPFPGIALARTREEIREVLVENGLNPGRPKTGDRSQAFEVRLIQALAEACEDPDAVACEWWARGCWIGEEGRKLPRTPAIFERKNKWALKPLEEDAAAEWRSN